jgi:7-keto-8-aminopelargonate synthetase-like enzyme
MTQVNRATGNYILFKNRKYNYFGGNNYLGLADDPAVKEAAIRSIRQYGVNFSASRQTTGTSLIHLELEMQLSAFKQKEDSVVFASGYMGNKILLQVLRNEYSAVFADEFSHPSIREGIPPDITRIFFYDHMAMSHLEMLLKKCRNFRPLIITDGVFALTGEIAPLDQINKLAQKYYALVVVDDSHSTGILGKNGRGTPEFFDLDNTEDLYQTETMSKAIGAYGGFISGNTDLISSIRKGSAAYQSSTALPPPVVSAGSAALKIMKDNPLLRTRLLDTAREIRTGVAKLGFHTTPGIMPIIPLMFRSPEKAKKLALFLEENNIVVPFIRYPVKTRMHMVRITASARHTQEQTDDLLELLKKWRNTHGRGQD